MMAQAGGSGPSATSAKPLLFISHRHADKPIADVLQKFVKDRSGGRIDVFQSSSPQAAGARVGRELQKELLEHLWKAGVIVLIYTSSDEDWSYCMWECGVATHPASPETKVIVFQCGSRPPAVYSHAVRVNVRESTDIQRFTNEFLTGKDFFPSQAEAIAPGFAPNGDEVRQAASQLESAIEILLIDDSNGGDDWATVPFLRLRLTYVEVDRIRELDDAQQGALLVQEAIRVAEIDADAMSLFGLGRVEQLVPFVRLIDAWKQGRPGASMEWVDDLIEQIRVGSHWRVPRRKWQLMQSVDAADRAKYAPVLTRIRSIPRERSHEFDVYFSKFDTNAEGAIKIGFVDERQTGPG